MSFFKLLLVVIVFFMVQCIFEILFMSALAKAGINYMSVDVQGESFIEVIEGISFFYFYSKVLYVAPFYCLLTITIIFYFFQGKGISLKNISVINIIVNILLFLVIWFAFENNFSFIANPLLGLLLAGLLIHILTSKFKGQLVILKTRNTEKVLCKYS